MLMQIINAGGIPSSFDETRPPDENNPKGYYELEGGKIINKLMDGSFPIEEYRGPETFVSPHRRTDRVRPFVMVLIVRNGSPSWLLQRDLRCLRKVSDPPVFPWWLNIFEPPLLD